MDRKKKKKRKEKIKVIQIKKNEEEVFQNLGGWNENE